MRKDLEDTYWRTYKQTMAAAQASRPYCDRCGLQVKLNENSALIVGEGFFHYACWMLEIDEPRQEEEEEEEEG